MIVLIFLYIMVGSVVMTFYSLIHDADFPFTEGSDKDESCKQILIGTFWPLWLLYRLIQITVWFVKSLWISIMWLIEKIKNKK